MFEDGSRGDSAWDAAPDPIDLSPPHDVDADWDDATFEAVIAADPDRERTVGELVRSAERDPVVSDLGSLDLAACSDDERIAVLVAAQRRINHYEAVKLAAVAAYAGGEPANDVCEEVFAWTEVAAALHLGEGSGRFLVFHARRLRSHLPGTLAAMLAGDLSLAKARTLLDATAGLTPEQCAEVETKVLGKAGGRNPAQHTSAVGRAVRRVDPHGWERRRQAKLADIAMVRRFHGDGVADLLLKSLDALDATLIWSAADTWARAAKAAGDPRTLDALRVAALVDWAARYLTGSPTDSDTKDGDTADRDTADRDTADGDSRAMPAPTRHGQPATVNIMIGLPDLLNPAAGGAATIAGCGEPLPTEAVAELLHQGARIRFALVDHQGRLAGISTKLHDPTVLQRVFVALRDVTLRVPGGSTTPIAGQDLDHLDPHGPTEPDNLHAPSRGWHRAKTFGHWTVTANPDGTITWTSRRTGRSYTTHPYDHRAGP